MTVYVHAFMTDTSICFQLIRLPILSECIKQDFSVPVNTVIGVLN